ncbi:unnamed protein product [Mesocestoides corti]|uniref:GST N-terminal domain-containing protein n=1 Tax=Mesocestoides corti TaxID=53468 RepID=A0A0R3ULS8_MESCO|nr:unnamed protein product [Mesocestoides corti]
MDLPIKNSKLKLIYFNVRGRGELIRFVLYAAEKDFEDSRIRDTDWPTLKPKMPFQQLPVLEVTPPGGQTVQLTESLAITRLLARTFNMYANTPEEIYLIERMISLAATLQEEIYGLHLKRAGDVKKLIESDHLMEYMDAIQMALKEKKGNFVTGANVTLADLQVVLLVDTMDKFLGHIDHECKQGLAAIRADVLKAKPKLANYLRTRPNTEL